MLVSSSKKGQDPHRVQYSSEEWGFIAGAFDDVSCGRNPSPLDAGDLGFSEPSVPDVGVSLLGVTQYAWRGINVSIESPAWPALRSHLGNTGRGARFRLFQGSWTADLVSLETGELLVFGWLSERSLDLLVESLARELE